MHVRVCGGVGVVALSWASFFFCVIYRGERREARRICNECFFCARCRAGEEGSAKIVAMYCCVWKGDARSGALMRLLTIS